MEPNYDLDYARRLVTENFDRLEAGRDPLHGFTSGGVRIHDPFMDASGRFDVDPVEEYGEAFLASSFARPTSEEGQQNDA